jgi:Lipocalin-like domain
MRPLPGRILPATLGLAFAVVSVSAQAQSAMTKDKLAGTWKVVSAKSTSVNNLFGEHPGGYIGFTPARFWVMLVDTDRKAPAAAALTDAEAVSMMKTGAAYTGKYDVDPAQTPDGIKVTIHVDAAQNQALTGTDRVFFIRVDGNKMSFKSPSVLIPMTGLTSVVQLEFVKAD